MRIIMQSFAQTREFFAAHCNTEEESAVKCYKKATFATSRFRYGARRRYGGWDLGGLEMLQKGCAHVCVTCKGTSTPPFPLPTD